MAIPSIRNRGLLTSVWPNRRASSLVVLALWSTLATATLEGQDFPSFDTVGHLGGFVNTTAVAGEHAFVCRANVMAVLDLSAPQPRQIGFVEFPDEPTSIAVAGELAFLSYRNTLEVVRVADPTSPAVVTTLQPVPAERRISDLAVFDGHLYLALAGDGLAVVDVSTPSAPAAGLTLDLPATALFLADGLLYAATGDGALVVLDLAEAARPAERGRFAVNGARQVFATDTHAYVVGGTNEGLTLVDVTDPDALAFAGAFADAAATFDRVFVDGAVAYLLERDGTLRVVDVAVPASPGELGSLPVAGFGFPASLHVADATAYFTVSGRFQAADVSDPSQPFLSRPPRAPEELSDLRYSGERLYVASPETLWGYSAADPAHPTLLGTAPAPGPDPLTRLAVTGDRVYAVDLGQHLHVVDFADPAQPAALGTYRAPDGIVELAADGSTAHLLLFGGLEVVDASDPLSPARIGQLDLPGLGRDLFLDAAQKRLYGVVSTAPTSGRLVIVDVADPATPTLVGDFLVRGEPIALWVAGDLAVVASNRNDGTWLLDAFDVADPANPRPLGTLRSPGEAWDVEVLADGLILVSVPGGSLHSFRHEGSSGFSTGPVHELPESRSFATTESGGDTFATSVNGFAFSSNKQVFGSKGGFVTRIRGGEEVILTMVVRPDEALSEGCTTEPPVGSHLFTPGALASLLAIPNAERGWNFREWTGDASGSDPRTTLLMDGDKVAVANFVQPVLTLSAVPVVDLICPPPPGQRRPIATAELCVNEVEDWRVNAIAFRGFGSGHEVEDLQQVELEVRGQTLINRYNGDDGLVRFTLDEEIAAGECLPVALLYRFDLSDSPCAFEPVKTFNVEIGVDDVAARPLSLPNFLKEPPDPFRLDSTTVGCVLKLPASDLETAASRRSAPSRRGEDPCVLNNRLGLACPSIQTAIDHPETVDGDVIDICPGTYREAVVLNKSLTVRSTDGPEVTFVEPPANRGNAGQDVYTVQRSDAKIFGQTLRKGRHGVFAQGVQRVEIGGSQQLQRNVIVENAQDGVHVEGEATDGTKILGNQIGPNGGRGVSVSAGADDTVIGEGSGVDALNGCTGSCNLISGNTGDGVSVGETGQPAESRGTLIRSNFIGTDRSGGAELPNQVGVRLFATRGTTISGNLIAGNRGHGLDIDRLVADADELDALIVGNRIGTNAAGDQAVSNRGSGIAVRRSRLGIGFRRQDGGLSACSGSCNLISGNLPQTLDDAGILAADGATVGIVGNLIGTDVTGTRGIGQQRLGIHFQNVSAASVIGGEDQDDGCQGLFNVISGNPAAGIQVARLAESGLQIVCNRIGTDFRGDRAVLDDTDNDGILVGVGSRGTFVRSNLISGNGVGVRYIDPETQQHSLLDNVIGFDLDESSRLPNRIGISIELASQFQIDQNRISGNDEIGLLIDGRGSGVGATRVVVTRNEILSNDEAGIRILGAATNEIGTRPRAQGGFAAGLGNVIGLNGHGIELLEGAQRNLIAGNQIGRTLANEILGNRVHGILAKDAGRNLIGIPDNVIVGSDDLGNLIANNGRFEGTTGVGDGIAVVDSQQVAIRGNRIFDNAGLGIDLEDDGVTVNDLGDRDTGANSLQNFPLLTSITKAPTGEIVVFGRLDTLPGTYDVDLFAVGNCDPSLHGEGDLHLVTQQPISVTVPNNGPGSFRAVIVPLPFSLDDALFTATATGASGTSEFSPCLSIGVLLVDDFESQDLAKWSLAVGVI